MQMGVDKENSCKQEKEDEKSTKEHGCGCFLMMMKGLITQKLNLGWVNKSRFSDRNEK